MTISKVHSCVKGVDQGTVLISTGAGSATSKACAVEPLRTIFAGPEGTQTKQKDFYRLCLRHGIQDMLIAN